MALIQVRPPPGADDGRPAIERWWYEAPRGRPGDLYAYSDRLSYAPGERAALHVYCGAGRFDLTVERDGAERVLVYERSGLAGATPDTPADCYARGCAWPVSLELPIGADWPSGGYVVTLRAEGARPAYHWFAVRPVGGAADRLLLVCSTATWTAYNDWGGCSHYEGIDGPSPELSLQRPWSRVTVELPAGAPRKSHPQDLPIGWVPRYPTAEWGWSTGESKHAGAAGWGTYERHFVRWAERQGYPLDVVTQHDLHQRPELLDGYRAVVLVGHDEYWSWEMRDAIDAFVDAGGGIVRLAGNFFWQIRLEQEGRVQVCHKYTARESDPVATDEARRHLLTSGWDDPLIGRQAARTMGTTASRGVYVRTFAGAPRASGGYTVYRPEHWLLDGSDLYYGDQLGASVQAFAYEVDGLDYTFRHGLPYATGVDGVDPDDVDILAMAPATLLEEDHGHGGPLFAAQDDARFIALMLEGDDSPASVQKVRRGNGMLAVYRRGAGCVVNVGSVEWVNGLRLREPFIEQITHTALRRFLG